MEHTTYRGYTTSGRLVEIFTMAKEDAGSEVTIERNGRKYAVVPNAVIADRIIMAMLDSRGLVLEGETHGTFKRDISVSMSESMWSAVADAVRDSLDSQINGWFEKPIVFPTALTNAAIRLSAAGVRPNDR